MFRAQTVGLGVLLFGCSDPTVSLSFDVPARFEDRTDSVSLRVLVPPTDDEFDFDCDSLAFGEVSADTVAGATVEEVISRDRKIDLRVPRQGFKLFLFEALDSEEQLVAAACGELPTIDEDTELSLIGEPATLVAADSLNQLGGVPLPDSVTVTVADVDAKTVEFADVRWSVLGPADTRTQGAGTTTNRGTYTFEPDAPGLPGPVALTVRTRWNRSEAPRFIGFEPTEILYNAVSANDSSLSPDQGDVEFHYVIGRLGPSGEKGLARLSARALDSEEREVIVTYWNGTTFVTNKSGLLPGIAALSQITRAGREVALAIGPTGWHEISAAGAVNSFPSPITLQALERVSKIFPVGGCGDGVTGYELLLVVTTEDEFAVVNNNRAQVTGVPPAALAGINIDRDGFLASGCVEELGGDSHRTVVFRENERVSFLAFMDTVRRGDIAAASGSVGFAPAVGGAGARLLASELSLSGTTLGRFRLIGVGSDQAFLEDVADDPSPSVPLSMAGGDVDGDGNADVVAVISTASRSRYRLLVSLGVDLDGGNLVGLSAEDTIRNAHVLLGDFDSDGDDDIVVFGDTGVRILRAGP